MGFAEICCKKPPVWIVSELYYPEETSTGYVLTKIAESLAREFAVGVICGPPGYAGGAKPFMRTERHNGVNIERCAVPSLNKNKVLTRMARAMLLTFALFLKALTRIERHDVVIVVTNPVPLLLSMALACRIRRARFLILVHDVFPENIAAAGALSSDSWILKLLSWLMAIPYAAARDIIVIGRDMKEVVGRKIGERFEKIAIIPNWADSQEVRPMSREDNPIIKRLGLQKRFILQFAGNLGRVQGLEYVAEAADLLAGEPVQFIFIGSGARQDVIESRLKQGNSNNITLLGPQPRSEQSLFLNACDVGIVSLAPGMYGLGVPSKTYNIMAAGKPVIAMVDENSEIGLLVREEDIGWVVAPGDSEGLAHAILEAKSDDARLRRMGVKARFLAETKCSFQHAARAYVDLLKKSAPVAGPVAEPGCRLAA